MDSHNTWTTIRGPGHFEAVDLVHELDGEVPGSAVLRERAFEPAVAPDASQPARLGVAAVDHVDPADVVGDAGGDNDDGDATVVAVEDYTTVFASLEERRANVASQRVRVVNQLHALLRDLVPGGAATALSAAVAAAMLRTVRPAGECERTREELARDLVREVRALDASLGDIAKRMAAALAAHQSRLLEVDGVGQVLGVRLIGRTGRASRFRSDAAFASYSGTAPIEVAGGERQRHRLSRSGDRQLNSALHLVAVTQVRMTNSHGRRYYDRKIADSKTRNEGGSVVVSAAADAASRWRARRR